MVTTILHIEHAGLILTPSIIATRRNELWLPRTEWANDESDWDRDVSELLPGDALDVVPISDTVDAKGRLLVSRKAFSITSVDNAWLHQPRIMRVDTITRELVRGYIGMVPAFIRKEEYHEYLESKNFNHQLLDHAELIKGDYIGGIVSDIHTPFGVKLEFGQYMLLREKEISGDILVTPERVEPRRSSVPERASRLPDYLARQISPVLVIENDSNLKASLEGFFTRGNVKVFSAADLTSALHLISGGETTTAEPVRLAIIDSNLSENGDDLGGLVAVERLAALQSVPVLLITGEQSIHRKLAQMDRILLHGFLPKPFTMRKFVEAIEAACAAKPKSISHWIQVDRLSDDWLSTHQAPAHSASSVEAFASMEDALSELSRLRVGGTIHIFRLHPRSFRAQSIAHIGEGLRWEPLRGKIEKSRIKDAAVSKVPIFETSDKYPALHYWTQQMMAYGSFYGVQVDVPGTPFLHVLVAFYRNRDGFTELFHSAVRLCAERVSRAVERTHRLQLDQAQQSFAMTGMSLECLAHELYNDQLNIEAATNELSVLLERADKFNSLQKQQVNEVATRLRQFIDDAMLKTKTLRGVRTTKEDASISFCLRRAVLGCRTIRTEILKDPKRVLIEKLIEPSVVDEAKVSAAPAALVIVFFNLLLNSVQQIAMMHPMRLHGKVWPVVDKRCDADGKHWLHVTICDTGPGIHRDDWVEVLKEGYSTRPGGMGLGLTICQQLLKGIQLDGRTAKVCVTASTIWDGTRLQVRLPIVK